MAMTSKAQKKIRSVAAGAVDLYREILGRDFITKTRHDILEKLRDHVGELEPKWVVTDMRNPTTPTEVYEVYGTAGVRYAVVREAAIIVMLHEEACANNLANGTWVRAGASPLAPVLTVVPPPEPSRAAAAESGLEDIVSNLSGAEVRAALALAEAEKEVARRRGAVALERCKVADAEHGLLVAQHALAEAEEVRDLRSAELGEVVRADAKV